MDAGSGSYSCLYFWTVRGMDAELKPPWMGSRRVQEYRQE
jgi:hypothetical protein